MNLFWTPRRSNGVSILFFLNRYITFTVQVLAWAPYPPSFQVRYTLLSINVMPNVLPGVQSRSMHSLHEVVTDLILVASHYFRHSTLFLLYSIFLGQVRAHIRPILGIVIPTVFKHSILCPQSICFVPRAI